MSDVPLVDLAPAHAEVAEVVNAGFARVIANTAFIGGPESPSGSRTGRAA